MDRVVGLELGADDYLPKPFEPRELVARIQNIFKRGKATEAENVYQLGELCIDLERKKLTRNDEEIVITATEFGLLSLLARNQDRVLSRDEIMQSLRGIDADIYSRGDRRTDQPPPAQITASRADSHGARTGLSTRESIMWQYLQSKWQSLVFRLLFYFLISMLVLAIILITSFAQRLKPQVQNEILPNLERYIEYLIADIGNPPDLGVAQQLADQLPFEIRIEGQGINWSSSSKLRAIEHYDFHPAPAPYDKIFFSHHRHDQFLLLQRQGYQYLFTVDNSFRHGSERRHWFLFLAVASILFLFILVDTAHVETD